MGASEADQAACGGSVPVAKRSGHAESRGLEGRDERPARGRGQPGAAPKGTQVENLCYERAGHPHWFILSRGVPAPTSSGTISGGGTALSSAAIVTATLL